MEAEWDRHWRRFDQATQRNPAELMRFRLVLRCLALRNRQARVVDLGSGQGVLASLIVRSHPQTSLLGLELSATGVSLKSGAGTGSSIPPVGSVGRPVSALGVVTLGDRRRLLGGPRTRG